MTKPKATGPRAATAGTFASGYQNEPTITWSGGAGSGGATRPKTARGHDADPGILLYKCRQCGHLFDGPTVPDLRLALVRMAHETMLPTEGWPLVSMMEPHDCGTVNGRLGIGELVGGRPTG